MAAPNITLDGSSIEVRAYVASQVGPSRRPFGKTQPVTLQAGQVAQVAQNGTGGVLFVSVLAVTGPGGNARTVFASNASPGDGKDPTVNMTYRVLFQDFVLLPGESLFVQNAASAQVTYSVATVSF